jgi:hypothetical protein
VKQGWMLQAWARVAEGHYTNEVPLPMLEPKEQAIYKLHSPLAYTM